MTMDRHPDQSAPLNHPRPKDWEAGRAWPPVVEVIDDEYAALLRTMTPEERWKQGREHFRFAASFARAAVRSQYPQWSEAQVDEECNRRMRIDPE